MKFFVEGLSLDDPLIDIVDDALQNAGCELDNRQYAEWDDDEQKGWDDYIENLTKDGYHT